MLRAPTTCTVLIIKGDASWPTTGSFTSRSREPARDADEALQRLLGWKFEKAPLPGPEYWLCNTGSDGPGSNGAVMQRQHPQQPWMNYVDVASIDVAIDKATKLGAKVALPKMPVPGVGAVAAIVDPQGNICELWEKANK